MTTTAVSSQKATKRWSDELSAEALLEMLRQMMLIRRFEERAAQSYQQARIGGFCHLYIGQEATAVGSIAALRHEDPVITAYRDHGHALARGMHPNYAMAELFGKITGCSKGKGGSMHYFDKPNNMYGGHAIVGGQVPLGVGLAFAIKYKNEPYVSVSYLGDGALNQGAFHEAMNLAAIWKLPAIICVENNGYSMGTAIARGTSAAEDLSVKAAAYGMRFGRCNGMDVLDTYNCFKEHAELARAGHGPAFIDCQTYRYKGHSMSDPQKYRTKEEVAQYEQHQDPINRLVNHLIEKNLATQEQINEIDKQAKDAALESVKYANESADLGVDELYTDVYVEPYGPYKTSAPALLMLDHEKKLKEQK
jgi:pyruvate dehydrogenase E1 component alpha subunit